MEGLEKIMDPGNRSLPRRAARWALVPANASRQRAVPRVHDHVRPDGGVGEDYGGDEWGNCANRDQSRGKAVAKGRKWYRDRGGIREGWRFTSRVRSSRHRYRWFRCGLPVRLVVEKVPTRLAGAADDER